MKRKTTLAYRNLTSLWILPLEIKKMNQLVRLAAEIVTEGRPVVPERKVDLIETGPRTAASDMLVAGMLSRGDWVDVAVWGS